MHHSEHAKDNSIIHFILSFKHEIGKEHMHAIYERLDT